MEALGRRFLQGEARRAAILALRFPPPSGTLAKAMAGSSLEEARKAAEDAWVRTYGEGEERGS